MDKPFSLQERILLSQEGIRVAPEVEKPVQSEPRFSVVEEIPQYGGCPHCGSAANWIVRLSWFHAPTEDTYWYQALCRNCGAAGPDVPVPVQTDSQGQQHVVCDRRAVVAKACAPEALMKQYELVREARTGRSADGTCRYCHGSGCAYCCGTGRA